jgi:hypothetical protein
MATAMATLTQTPPELELGLGETGSFAIMARAAAGDPLDLPVDFPRLGRAGENGPAGWRAGGREREPNRVWQYSRGSQPL